MIKFEVWPGTYIHVTASEYKLLAAQEQGRRDYRNGFNKPPMLFDRDSITAWRAGWSGAAGIAQTQYN